MEERQVTVSPSDLIDIMRTADAIYPGTRDRKILFIKILKRYTGWGLVETKQFADRYFEHKQYEREFGRSI